MRNHTIEKELEVLIDWIVENKDKLERKDMRKKIRARILDCFFLIVRNLGLKG